MHNLPNCPACNSEYTYEDGALYICPECGHEWTAEQEAEEKEKQITRDSNGNIIADGDTITIIKDLKVKGSSSPLKMGTKVKNIRIVDDVDGGHDLEGKVDGFGVLYIKSKFVKKL
ncbi:zinc ribbon domain-containing protein YjdM [Oceanobacillus massiliensis]|uniref:zinc ribbon domain-containing protein YjdM n=1 Tax=Oceanobacillus massiliensis TaxID=1465765 RepID=UPI000287C3C3|nr:zinc ribbon domain-containing protein YjdM [Oceanobacillus massiliensis]